MKDLTFIADELFNKIRGRFPSVTIGDGEGKVTNKPQDARFFDFDFKEGTQNLGKISVNLLDDKISLMYSNDVVENQDEITKGKWYDFLKELRMFAKKRLLNFDTRNINKSNLDKRDYKFLATNRPGDEIMSEAKLYGTSKISYQNIGEARLVLKHSQAVNQDLPSGRSQHVESIYIDSPQGERFKYPFKHINGARAMARHVSEGGTAYDDFGKHITSLSEELYKLRKFKNYMGRSSVMAESLAGYVDVVKERITSVKKTIDTLQKPNAYKEAFESFEKPVLEDVPTDVAENWIDQLTIKQFNEELKDVFPYIYKLVSEATKATELGPEDLLGESQVNEGLGDVEMWLKDLEKTDKATYEEVRKWAISKVRDAMKAGKIDPATAKPGDMYKYLDSIIDSSSYANDYTTWKDTQPSLFDLIKQQDENTNEVKEEKNCGCGQDPCITYGEKNEDIEHAFESLMGQFAEGYMKGYQKYHCKDCGDTMHKPTTDCSHDPHDEKGNWWRDDNGNGIPDAMEGNKFTAALKKAKDNDDDEMDVDGEKIPVTEFVLSLFDRETGQFPKGETAVLTAVEKDYGEQYINPAKEFIEAIYSKFEEFSVPADDIMVDSEQNGHVMEPTISQEEEMGEGSGLQYHTGVKKHGKEYMDKAAQAGRDGASQEELGRLKDKYSKAEKNKTTKEAQDIMRLAGL